MRCKKYRKKIPFYLYGELPEKENREFENHIRECSECAHDLEYTKKVFNVVEKDREVQMPEANWEKCWKGISSAVEKKDRKKECERKPCLSDIDPVPVTCNSRNEEKREKKKG